MKPASIWTALLLALALVVPTYSGQVDDAPVPPKDARWTLFCKSFNGPAHMIDAKRAKEQWTKTSSLRGFYVVHEENESTLYYGYYRAYNDLNDTGESRRAQADRAALDKLQDPNGDRPFANAIFVELASSDPPAPAEWNLANAKGYWSLQIAAYKDSPERKKAAVDSVKAAREKGIEAYFFHGQTTSSVCIGCWPREAVKEQEAAVAESSEPDQPILVAAQPLSPGIGRNLIDRDGKRVKTLAPRIEPVDPTMIQMMKEYPSHQINGLEVVKRGKDRNGQAVEQREPSFLVLVPQNPQQQQNTGEPQLVNQQQPANQASAQFDSTQAPQHGDNTPAPPRPVTKGTGKLRSLKD